MDNSVFNTIEVSEEKCDQCQEKKLVVSGGVYSRLCKDCLLKYANEINKYIFYKRRKK